MQTKVITINSQIFEVADESLTGSQIKTLGRLPHEDLYEVRGEDRVAVADDDLIALDGMARRFVTVPPAAQAGVEPERTLTIYVDGDPYETDKRILTGAEIKALAKKPAGNRLFRLAGEGQRIPVADDEKVHLHEGEQFVTLPPVGRAS